jgi:SsrA-binding protein
MAQEENSRQIVATNRRARFDYEIVDTVEAGMALLGPEVKSLRAGNANLSDGYAFVRRGQMFLANVHIGAYENAWRENAEPRRERKLLLHRHEIRRLETKASEPGMTLIPLRLYFKNGRAKVEIGLCRGKQRHDKRESIRKRESDRDLQRAMRGRGRGRSRG